MILELVCPFQRNSWINPVNFSSSEVNKVKVSQALVSSVTKFELNTPGEWRDRQQGCLLSRRWFLSSPARWKSHLSGRALKKTQFVFSQTGPLKFSLCPSDKENKEQRERLCLCGKNGSLSFTRLNTSLDYQGPCLSVAIVQLLCQRNGMKRWKEQSCQELSASPSEPHKLLFGHHGQQRNQGHCSEDDRKHIRKRISLVHMGCFGSEGSKGHL